MLAMFLIGFACFIFGAIIGSEGIKHDIRVHARIKKPYKIGLYHFNISRDCRIK